MLQPGPPPPPPPAPLSTSPPLSPAAVLKGPAAPAGADGPQMYLNPTEEQHKSLRCLRNANKTKAVKECTNLQRWRY